MYSIPADAPVERYIPTQSYDWHAMTLEDEGAFYPTAGWHDAVKVDRIGSLTERFHGGYNAFSTRYTQKYSTEVIKRCLGVGVDVAVLTPA